MILDYPQSFEDKGILLNTMWALSVAKLETSVGSAIQWPKKVRKGCKKEEDKYEGLPDQGLYIQKAGLAG